MVSASASTSEQAHPAPAVTRCDRPPVFALLSGSALDGQYLCVNVDPSWNPASERALHGDELGFAASLGARRRLAWLAGRLTLRRLAEQVGVPCRDAILANGAGAPVLPPGLQASISHKGLVIVAFLTMREGERVGVDIETRAQHRKGIRRALTPAELREVASAPAGRQGEAEVMRLCVKEAVFKAAHSRMRRPIPFGAVQVHTNSNGTVSVVHNLVSSEGRVGVDAAVLVTGDYVLAFARSVLE